MKSQLLPLKLREKYFKFRQKQFLAERKEWKQVIDFRGCKFFAGADNKLESALLSPYGGYDWDNFTAIEHFTKKGDVCFDIGANIGIYSVILSHISGNAQNVHSFEPVNHIRERLTSNCKLNGFDDININNFALGAEKSSAEMYQIKDGVFRGGTSTFIQNDNVDKLGKDKFDLCKVDIIKLDDYVSDNKLNRINFMKIDVESFEWQVLQGAQKSISKFTPTILMEYDPIRHTEDSENNNFKEFFLDNKYQVYEFKSFGNHINLLPFNFDHTPIQRNILCFNSKLAK